jgi:hypothetical protein
LLETATLPSVAGDRVATSPEPPRQCLKIRSFTVFKWLQKGRLLGRELAKGMPWQITLSSPQIAELRTQVRRTNQSKKEAS